MSSNDHHVLIAVAQSKIEGLVDSAKRIEARLELIEKRLEERVEDVDNRIDSLYTLSIGALISALIAIGGLFVKPSTGFSFSAPNTKGAESKANQTGFKGSIQPPKSLANNSK